MKIIFHAAFRDTSNLMDNFTSRLISILHTKNNFTRWIKGSIIHNNFTRWM